MTTDQTVVRSHHTTACSIPTVFLCTVGLLAGLLACGGCTDHVQPLSPAGNAPAGPAQAAAPPVSKPSKEQIAGWLTTDLPALQEEIAATPVNLKEPQLTPNEWGQEILQVLYERPAIVRTLPAEIHLVLLPVTGGRYAVGVNNGLLIEPRNGGTIRGITANLLNHRGQVRSGMRAYLEMRAASIQTTAQKRERVSDVVWFGTDEQLAQAIAKGPPPKVAPDSVVAGPDLQAVPAGKLARGTPLWMRCGDQWARGTVAEDSDQDPVKLVVSLVRRDKPYMPWSAELSRADLRIEGEALVELQRDPNSFRDLADALDGKLARQGAPHPLKPVDPAHLAEGTPVLDFWNGMLDPCKTTGPVQGNSVAIQRVGLDNAQKNPLVKPLYLDPFGENP